MVGGSVFYAAEAQETSNAKAEAEDAVEHLDKELQENENRRLEAERWEQQLSSLVWICTSTQKMSKVTVIDANNPADVLEVFNVCQGHLLCIASVPGAKESDYAQSSNENSIRNSVNDSENNNGVCEDVTNANENDEQNGRRNHQDAEVAVEKNKSESDNQSEDQANENTAEDQNSTNEPQSLESIDSETANLGKVSFVRCNAEAHPPQSNKDVNEEAKDEVTEETPIEKMSSVQPTMWLGAQNGAVFVHSAVAKWSVCLHSVKLKDAALAIVYVITPFSSKDCSIQKENLNESLSKNLLPRS